MNELHKTLDEYENVNSKEEQRKGLCSNNVSSRCSSLDVTPDFDQEAHNAKIDQLAKILVDIYIENHKNEQHSNEP